ncbi:hypothetical protein CSB93_6505 [Pseudomonas paraeruginosa]|uniref:Uncharacterized protein n=1 Tax=Pseudomonas paraeruginosa TaxID=2994495 RepID=A0A2R3J385_9PSED|nr:hypothetical protein CSB93_6505 [Pseudomonas paraeruginosa]
MRIAQGLAGIRYRGRRGRGAETGEQQRQAGKAGAVAGQGLVAGWPVGGGR